MFPRGPVQKSMKFGFVMLLTTVLQGDLLAQANHTYPRTAVQHFGKAKPEWYAKFDLSLIIHTDVDRARRIKEINPDATLVWVDGWTSYGENNYVQDYIPIETPEYFVQGPDGNQLKLNWGELLDMSDLCPKVNGERYLDRHPKHLASLVDLTVFDGIGSDWCWGRPHNTPVIDLDRNGVNDYDEHGKKWVDKHWLDGVEQFIANLRNEVGPDKLIWINSGGLHSWGYDNSNGLEIERQSGFLNWNSYWKSYKKFMANAREPHILLMDVRPNAGDPHRPEHTKDYFQLMRFMLTATMLGDGYFNFSPVEAGEHHFQMYFDEFDLDLGYPTQAAQQLSNGAFVRFFDKGVSIVNPTGAPVTITQGDLAGLSGYRGPYYRFQGGQDIEFNNGRMFDRIELWGGYYYRSKGDILLGDGIILLDHQRTVVSDIMVDNNNMDSSPGNGPAVYTAGWKESADGDLYWNQKVKPVKDWYPHIFTVGGDGSQTATFTPNVGVAGKYEVFEWHGSVGNGQMARRVPHKIVHAGGSTTKYVDQRAHQGRMNSLGVYNFTKGQSGKLIISNEANGMVIADMILFKYRGEDGVVDNVDTQAPTAPKGVAVEKR